MAIGDNDQQEAQNMKQEKQLNTLLLDKVKALNSASTRLSKNYNKIYKQSKKVAKLIQRKEKMNEKELKAEWGKLQTQDNMGRIKAMSKKLKADESNESKISKEEAMIIQDVLTKLHTSILDTQKILAEDTEIYNVLNEIYAKDMQDYQLEITSLNKA